VHLSATYPYNPLLIVREVNATLSGPIRFSRDRIWLYGGALFIAGLWQLLGTTLRDPDLADWSCFWSGGATVGTRALLIPHLHGAFQSAHGYHVAIWPYLPAFAWLFAPAAHLSLFASYVLNALLMLGLAVLAGALLAKAFELPRWFGIAAALAWAPVKVAALSGQNTPLALILITVATIAARRHNALVVGLAIGALCYKPTIAAPFIVLLLLRCEWRALSMVILSAIYWYLGSVAATGGSWHWLQQYLAAIAVYAAGDFARNAQNVVSLPGALARLGCPWSLAAAMGILLFVVAIPTLRRLALADALAVTSALAVAASLHAWQYEPVILLPALFYLARFGGARLWIVIGAYVLAALSVVNAPGLTWNLTLIAVLAITVATLDPQPWTRKKSDGSNHTRPARV
jgi:Glycosyltransferase family 87